MKRVLLFSILFFSLTVSGQEITGPELLDKAIAFHDPNNNWKTFKGTLKITMETPKSSDRSSTIELNLPKSFFKVEVTKDDDTYSYILNADECEIALNGSSEITETDKERLRLSCDRGKMYRDYYTYLYGLPMKLRDKGTIIHEKVEHKVFKGKEYLVLKATYEKEVGEDIWYFYFDPETYAMEVYQFFHDESKNDGEYILLSGIEEINGVKMPMTRKWHYNEDDKYLGTDILEKQ